MKKHRDSLPLHAQLIDIRPINDFRQHYSTNALPFSVEQFKNYAPYLIAKNTPLLFLTTKDTIDNLQHYNQIVDHLGYNTILGYLLVEDIADQLTESINTVSAIDFLTAQEPYQLVDLRHPEEITRPAPKANLVNLPLQSLVDTAATLHKDRPIYTLCGSGKRATIASAYLNQLGYTTTVIEGGMAALNPLVNS